MSQNSWKTVWILNYLIPSNQGSKYRSKSDCEAKRKRNFFREKLRSENIFRLCEANNFSKLRKIAKNWEIAKKFLSRKESFSAFFYFILVNKYFIFDFTSQYRLFGHQKRVFFFLKSVSSNSQLWPVEWLLCMNAEISYWLPIGAAVGLGKWSAGLIGAWIRYLGGRGAAVRRCCWLGIVQECTYGGN